jgi:hypothetical protein
MLLGKPGVCRFIPVKAQTQTKKWHPSISRICQQSHWHGFSFQCHDGDGKQVVFKRSDGPFKFAPMDNDHYLGFHFAKRSKLLSSLVDGTLVIEVHMKLAMPTISVLPPLIPENPLAKMIKGLLLKMW